MGSLAINFPALFPSRTQGYATKPLLAAKLMAFARLEATGVDTSHVIVATENLMELWEY